MSNIFYLLAYHILDDIISHRTKELEMTKTEVIKMFMNAVDQYTKAIDKTAQPIGVRTRHSLVVVKRNSLLIRKNKFFDKSFRTRIPTSQL